MSAAFSGSWSLPVRCTQVAGARPTARRYPPPGVMVDSDGQRLHVVCAGEGRPAVLFDCAIAASSLSWTPVLRDSLGIHSCLCVRSRGPGVE